MLIKGNVLPDEQNKMETSGLSCGVKCKDEGYISLL